MNLVIIDTDIFSEIMKAKDNNVISNSMKYIREHKKFTISSMTILEIVKGFRKIGNEGKLKNFISRLNHVNVLNLDSVSAEISGKIISDLEKIGQPIGLADSIIAGIAIASNLPVVTGNYRH
ncbi:MAG: PIN domain-containing protein [Leptospiraceae bacterium]|nr:PIN domain-containing protein [Leptospiraceae bacterium]